MGAVCTRSAILKNKIFSKFLPLWFNTGKADPIPILRTCQITLEGNKRHSYMIPAQNLTYPPPIWNCGTEYPRHMILPGSLHTLTWRLSEIRQILHSSLNGIWRHYSRLQSKRSLVYLPLGLWCIGVIGGTRKSLLECNLSMWTVWVVTALPVARSCYCSRTNTSRQVFNILRYLLAVPYPNKFTMTSSNFASICPMQKPCWRRKTIFCLSTGRIDTPTPFIRYIYVYTGSLQIA